MPQEFGYCLECGETYILGDFRFVDSPEDEDATPDEYWLLNRLSCPSIRRAWVCRQCDTVTQTVEIPVSVLFDLVADSPAKLEELEQYFPSAPNSTLAVRRSMSQLFSPDEALASVVGAGQLSHNEAVAKVWSYVNKHGLQDSRNKRLIRADSTLERVFGASMIDMFDMSELIFDHLSSE